MLMRIKLVLAVLILVAVAMAQANGKDAENRIRALDSEWSQAAQSKDVDKMVSYYTDDASAFPFNAPIATGKEQIRQLWSALMAKPGFSLSFAPTKIDGAESNDLAYDWVRNARRIYDHLLLRSRRPASDPQRSSRKDYVHHLGRRRPACIRSRRHRSRVVPRL